jgi:hypothetical protein
MADFVADERVQEGGARLGEEAVAVADEPGETEDDRRLTIALAERIAAAGARVHSHAFMPLPGTPLAGAAPTQITDDVAAAVARLESRGAAYGQWRKQAGVAGDLVALRRERPRLPRA